MSGGPVLAGVLAAILLVAAVFSTRSAIDEVDVERYHASIRESASRFPFEFEGWTGIEVDLPPSATKLLRPNAIVARRYHSSEREGVWATLMVVQCADIRDMQGHYPPNCYPAHGWRGEEGVERVSFGELDALKYGFNRRGDGGEERISVYNLFILPNGQPTVKMTDVRRESSDYRARPYGAAQVQVVISGDVDEGEHPWVLSEMRRIAEPVVAALLLGRDGAERGAVDE